MSKELKEAIRKISNIVDQWTDMKLDANYALELLLPLLKTVTSYFEGEDRAAESSSDPNLETPGAEEYELVEKEELQEVEGDLFSKTEDLEEQKEDVREEDEPKFKKSPKKKRKEFAGSNGEIPF